MQTKLCKLCGVEKTVDNFWKSSNSKDGLFASCKECNSTLKKSYYLENRKKLRTYGKIYHDNVVVKKYIYYVCYRTLYAHRKQGYIIDITIPELMELAKQAERCPTCNVKLDKELGHKKTCQTNSLSFDCIDNQKNFVRGNVQILCNHCNSLKRKKGWTGGIHTSKILNKIQNLSQKALTRKDRLTPKQIDILSKCSDIVSP